jgi:hypothetical protein
VADFNIHFLCSCFSFNSRVLYGILVDVFKCLLFWTKYLRWLLIGHPMYYAIHGGVWFLGTKPRLDVVK